MGFEIACINTNSDIIDRHYIKQLVANYDCKFCAKYDATNTDAILNYCHNNLKK